MAKSNEVSKNGLKFKKIKTTKKKMRKSQKEKPSRNPKIKAGQKPKRKEKTGNAKVLRLLQFMASQNARKGY